ncbi:MAG TPA: serine--tRNA ligase [Candidatus Baltobacteraceae bacterium]|jgi:seryl-tRNA synthetase|nr:serine--tRNA ligase [Candidatus Baltobacteraceae bacterium]
MLALDYIKKHPEVVEEAARVKGVSIDVASILTLNDERVKLQRLVDERGAEQNRLSKLVPNAPTEDRTRFIARSRELRGEIESDRTTLASVESRLHEMLLRVPNIPSPDAPVGDASQNREVRTWGEVRDSAPRDHVELMLLNAWGDLERIAAVSGTRSYMLRGELGLLEPALHRFAMDVAVERGFEPMLVPSMARSSAFVGSGHFPDGVEDTYRVEDDLYLAGTSEVVLNALHSGDILSVSELPKKYAGYSTCFRRESGSAGRDVRGLVRVHQFTKVEQYVICEANFELSAQFHDELLANAEHILRMLEIPYRVVECATGDMGLGKFRMNDIESWVPSQRQYRETHSCSSLTDWQARRSNLRYRGADGEVKYAFTLNNTAIATPRILVPFLENHQLEDGRVSIPPALRPYMYGRTTIGKRRAEP